MNLAIKITAILVTFAVVTLAVVLYLRHFGNTEVPAYEEILPTFPAPEELSPAELPHFRLGHPRLPHPNSDEIRFLQQKNPGFFLNHKNRAKGGTGGLYSGILMALVEPGSQDLAILHKRLLETEPGYRGNNVGVVALGYDWLYYQWGADQLHQLRRRVIDNCLYTINWIRAQRLSPYNVFLYNRTLQNLMACALAVYGDSEAADVIMRFTHYFWKDVVLPVWRQVMGENGGWHEGGQYVGIGIGNAIYQLPAMWRSATGEDYFASQPGIRGFLDFLVYRIRPDGTHFRWGDGGFFNKQSLDRLALALEYNHWPSYSLAGKPHFSPTSWPWGPIAEPDKYDQNAFNSLPLHRFFDGLGLLVTRSDWTPNATYMTFKVGNNYWSHSHLDQGSFTIYKGGALAIDSGIYGPKYGSDHHMNYTYQTIAHNTVTVTDPNDITPLPGKKDYRYIANDGGQRRVGSGWGLESAPLDLDEWTRKKDLYHTGKMLGVAATEDFIVATGDATPAYTNRHSGSGTFSDRTRRVESFLRTFAYDRTNDAILIFDRVETTHPDFRSRWLLHTIDKPSVTKQTFEIAVSPESRPGHTGGVMAGQVLLPHHANVLAIGGRGFDFFADGHNYDEDGSVRKKVNPYAEPGGWRLEISSIRAGSKQNFLIVLFPGLADNIPNAHAQLLNHDRRRGAEISGPTTRTRWWFTEDGLPDEVEVITNRTTQTYSIEYSTGRAILQ